MTNLELSCAKSRSTSMLRSCRIMFWRPTFTRTSLTTTVHVNLFVKDRCIPPPVHLRWRHKIHCRNHWKSTTVTMSDARHRIGRVISDSVTFFNYYQDRQYHTSQIRHNPSRWRVKKKKIIGCRNYKRTWHSSSRTSRNIFKLFGCLRPRIVT